MKIAIFEPKFFTPRAQAVSYLVYLKNLLEYIAHHHEVVIFCQVDEKYCNDYREDNNIKIYTLSKSRKSPQRRLSAHQQFFSPFEIAHAAKIIKRTKPDVLYTLGSPFFGVFANILRVMTGVPTIHHIFFIPSRKWWKAASVEGWRMPLFHFLIEAVKNAFIELMRPLYLVPPSLNRLDKIIAASPYLMQRLIKEFGLAPSQIEVLNYAVPLPRIANNSQEQKEILITYFGNLWQRSGVLDVVKAFSSVSKRHPQVKLMIAASNINRIVSEYLDRLIQKHSLREQVILKGEVRDVYREVLAPSAVVALPFYYTPSLKLLEAMAAAKPVITTAIEWIPEVITDMVNGLLVEPGNIEAIAQKMKRCIEDSALAYTVGANARKTIEEKFCIENNESRFLEIAQRVIQ